MLPNWLLGKSKSKLQEILGGGGGGTDYTAGDGIDISNGVISFDPATTPAIDPSKVDGLNDDLAALAPKTALSNANILHNPWFQVNQRGVMTLSTNGYFVDRWRALCATAGTTTYTLNSDGTITIDNSLGEGPAYFIQRRTSKTISRVTGRKITVSVMFSDGIVRSGTGIYSNTETITYYSNDDIRIQSIAQNEGQFFVLRVEAGKTVTIKALKLELGSVSTLAMDTAPDMATELAKCQRYFQRLIIKGTTTSNVRPTISLSNAATSTICWFPIYLEASMRAIPELSLVGDFAIAEGSVAQAVASTSDNTLSIARVGTNSTGPFINLSCTPSTEVLTPGSTYKLVGITPQEPIYIDFSAEL